MSDQDGLIGSKLPYCYGDIQSKKLYDSITLDGQGTRMTAVLTLSADDVKILEEHWAELCSTTSLNFVLKRSEGSRLHAQLLVTFTDDVIESILHQRKSIGVWKMDRDEMKLIVARSVTEPISRKEVSKDDYHFLSQEVGVIQRRLGMTFGFTKKNKKIWITRKFDAHVVTRFIREKAKAAADTVTSESST